MMAMLAIPAYAATYSDVTKSKLDTKSYEAIVYVDLPADAGVRHVAHAKKDRLCLRRQRDLHL